MIAPGFTPIDTTTLPPPTEETHEPTYDDILDLLAAAGNDDAGAGLLMEICHDLAATFKQFTAGDVEDVQHAHDMRVAYELEHTDFIVFCDIPGGAAHLVLNSVMPDEARAQPDTPHDLLNRFFLGEEHVFVHSYAKNCILAVAPAG